MRHYSPLLLVSVFVGIANKFVVSFIISGKPFESISAFIDVPVASKTVDLIVESDRSQESFFC